MGIVQIEIHGLLLPKIFDQTSIGGFYCLIFCKLDLAGSGEECLALTGQKKYDIILLDHMMPDMDGIETLRLLRKDKDNLNHDTVVIALTANAVAGCKEMYMEYGFDEYVSKPIESEKLEALLLRLLPEHMIEYEQENLDKKAETVKEMQEVESMSDEGTVGSVNEQLRMTEIDKSIGLSYVMDSEELYLEIVQAFCEQMEEYLPQLKQCFEERNWASYAVLTHAIKGNAHNIGAVNFSEFSKKQEFAAKENDESILLADYDQYIKMLVKLEENAKNILNK